MSPAHSFFRWCRPYLGVCLASAAMAFALTWLFAPGLATNDSGHRACQGWSLFAGTQGMSGQVLSQVFPPLLSVVMAALRWLTGGWWITTFLGAWWMFLGIGVFARRVLGPRWWMAWLTLCAVPLVWNQAAAMLADSWVCGALCTLLAGVLGVRAENSASCRTWVCVVIGVSSIAVFAFRANSLTLLPVLFACVWIRWKPLGNPWRFAGLVCVAVGVLVSMAASAAVPWKKADVVATILACEHVSALRLARDDGRMDVIDAHSLDGYVQNSLGAPSKVQNADFGPTARAFASHDWALFHETCFGADPPIPARLVREDGAIARAAFWKLVREEPMLYARTKARLWVTMLGCRHQGAQIFIPRTHPAWSAAMGVDLAAARSGAALRAGDWLLRAGERVTRATIALWMPYLWLGASGVALCVLWRRSSSPRGEAGWLLGAAWSYYGGFLLLAPSFEWRYFLPSFVLVVVGSVGALARALARRP